VTLDRASVQSRLDRVRGYMRAAPLDALVVTHLTNVQYLTGFSGTAGALVLLPGACLLVVDFRYVTAARAVTEPLDGLVAVSTFDTSYDEALIQILLREGSARVAIEGAYLPVGRFNALASGLAAQSPLPVAPAESAPILVPSERMVERARIIKDAAEVATLREAGRRLARVAREVPALVEEGRTEQAIAEDIERALRTAGFSRPAFETIVASGPNGALPHARPTMRPIQKGEATVLDFGGVYDGYCVDLTRTVQLGPVSAAIQHLCAAVAEAQNAAIRAVRPGEKASVIDRAARSVLERHGLGEAFGHGTGHGLGLEVHEEPRIGRAIPRLEDERLEPGMVFTIEPGAYVAGLGGVRIEDDVLVTDTGCEVLTR
jgi:Xaa-Pro aminopeptidase